MYSYSLRTLSYLGSIFSPLCASRLLENKVCKPLLSRALKIHERVPLTEKDDEPPSASDETNLYQKRRTLTSDTNSLEFSKLAEYRFVYPEFLPNPDMARRHPIREKLERQDMMARRKQLEIPEFYVGSIMSVTASDPYAPGKSSRFVGICILREEFGLRTHFILRNVVDHQGVEIRYDLYNPAIQSIQVLHLEKRLDDHLVYLRDALPEYSTFPFNMEAVPHPESGQVPLNLLKVKLKPRPWYARWERFNLRGIEQSTIDDRITEKMKGQAKVRGEKSEPWRKYDLMDEYRKVIHEEDQATIWKEVDEHHQQVQEVRKRDRRKKLLEKQKGNKLIV